MIRTTPGSTPSLPRLRAAMCATSRVGARIRSTVDGAEIELSDGSRVLLFREPHVSPEAFMAAVVQWARRRGATSIEIED